MKKLLSIVLSLCMLLSITSGLNMVAFADTDGYYTYSISNGKATITECDANASGVITIPSTLGGYPVTSIGDYAFYSCDSLTGAIIPYTVTNIGNGAFSWCSNLTSITIPDNVTSIGDSAFFRCKSLTSITIPDNVTSIGREAFNECESLTSINVDIENQYYLSEDGVLFNKNKNVLIQYPIGNTRASYTIPDSVTSIGNYAFSGCSKLTSISIPDGVTSIGGGAFAACRKLTSITIPDSVTSIGNAAFNCCISLTSITISDNVTSIGVWTFYGCSSLTNVTIPDSVTSIGMEAFYCCEGLTSITIPDSVTTIDSGTFSECTGLTSVTIPDSITSIGYRTFYHCTSLTSVTIPDSITSIGDDAFYCCEGLTSITIPDSVTNIGGSAFCGCINLTDVYYSGSFFQWLAVFINGDNDNLLDAVIYCSDGILDGRHRMYDYVELYDNTAKITTYYRDSTNLIIPPMIDGLVVTIIGEWAFYCCEGLTSVAIPNSVVSIGEWAFHGCENLTNVVLPDSLTSIGAVAFSNCTSLTSITIPDNVISIGEGAFNGCENLKSITIPNSVTSIGDYAFCFCESLSDVYYSGSESDWNKIDIGFDNEYLTNATIHYSFVDEPSHTHNYTEVVTPPTCTAQGFTTHTCECGDSYIDNYSAMLDHNWNGEIIVTPATCVKLGTIEYKCLECGETKLDTLPIIDHTYESAITPATPNTKGYTTHTCSVCGDQYIDNYTPYASDNSALMAVLIQIDSYSPDDYSSASYSNLVRVLYKNINVIDNNSSQTDIDIATMEFLTAMNELEPYFNLTVTATNGTVSGINGETESLLNGTSVTLSASADEGYNFVGWYDVINNRYLSRDAEYTFKITGNMELKAVYVNDNSATLTFTTYSNWIKSTVTKTIDEWAEVDSIDSLVPDVPYRYGYSNGRWVYDNADVLARLQTGEDVSLVPEYDEDDTSLPTPPEPNGNEPVLDLYYKLDADANVGSFVMAAGIPENCQIESIGTAFYYKNADEFDPTKFVLNVNNKMLVSRFNTDEIEDVYITNISKLSGRYNWAVRGYVTYYDANGNLKTVYSNQINIVNREQV